jgi:hypothetical protein
MSKIWDDQVNNNRSRGKKSYKMVKFKEARRQNGIQKKHSNN